MLHLTLKYQTPDERHQAFDLNSLSLIVGLKTQII